MSKYVFKNPEVEKALRLVAKELGYSDDEFDNDVKFWANGKRIWIDAFDDREEFDFPSSLLKKVEEFDPTGWNNADVIPPEDEDDPKTSKVMIVENSDGFLSKAYFNFELKKWCKLCSCDEIEFSRYRLYPED